MYSNSSITRIVAGAVAISSSMAYGAEALSWRCDKAEVYAGGCLTLILEKGVVPLREIQLRINGTDVGSLNMFGPTHKTDSHVYILIWAGTANNTGPNQGGERILYPVFASPGEVLLELSGTGVAENPVEIEVRPLPESGKSSIDLIYPYLEDVQKGVPMWPNLIASAGKRASLVDHAAVFESDAALRSVLAHPDWAEVVPAMLVQLRAKSALSVSGGTEREAAQGMARASRLISTLKLDDIDPGRNEFAVVALERLRAQRKMAELALRKLEGR